MNWIKRIFCGHNGGLSFVRNIYGDEINHSGGNRSIWECKRCGAHVRHPFLNEPPLVDAARAGGETS